MKMAVAAMAVLLTVAWVGMVLVSTALERKEGRELAHV